MVLLVTLACLPACAATLTGSFYESAEPARRPWADEVKVESGGSLEAPSRRVRLSAPAGARARTLRLWLALQNGHAIVWSSVPGGPGAYYSDHSFRVQDTVIREYVFHYRANSNNQRIQVEAQLVSGAAPGRTGLAVVGVSLGPERENKPPRVRLLTPARGSTFRSPASFTVEAEADDPDGKIRKVEFYGASVAIKLGEALSPPYRLEYKREGNYAGSFCARAIDDQGAAVDSGVVRFRIESKGSAPPPVPPLSRSFVAPGDPAMGWEGVASIVELPSGDLLAAWFSGKYELSRDSGLWASRLKKGAKSWTKPYPMIDAPGVGEGNPVLFFHQGVLWCFHSRLHGFSIEFSRLHYSKSFDEGKTWQAAVAMPEPPFEYPTGTLPATRPLVLSNGDILLPLNREAYDPDPKKQWMSFFMISSDNGRAWRETAPLHSLPGNLQPTVVELAGRSLLAFFRMRGLNGNIWRSVSRDGGSSWAPLERTEFPLPSSRVALARTKSGALVLAYNHHPTDRTPLALRISRDEGATWGPPRVVESGGFAYTYPYLIQTLDGRIHMVYNDHYQAIRHMVVDEAWFDR